MIDNRSVQNFLAGQHFYKGKLDGIWGPESRKAQDHFLTTRKIAMAGWPDTRRRIALEQLMMKSVGINPGKVIDIDGIKGPVYQYAIELWQNHLRDIAPPSAVIAHQPTKFPRQQDVPTFYGERGSCQVKLESPYPLYLDWDISQIVTKFSIHEKCHDSALRAMQKTKDFYGVERLTQLGLNQFGGCLNVRKMRGGNAWSMHSWGIAIDWDADRNPLRANHKTATLAKQECARFLDFWEEEGWISLGRERDFDWMHVQAARL